MCFHFPKINSKKQGADHEHESLNRCRRLVTNSNCMYMYTYTICSNVNPCQLKHDALEIVTNPSVGVGMDRGVGTGLADPAAARPMFEPALMIQLKNLPAIFVKFSHHR